MVTPGMPAFPTPSGWDTPGMDLRTWIAARMMAANRMSLSVNSTSEYIAQRAVADTDALIKELNK